MRRSKFLLVLGAACAVMGITASGAFAGVDAAAKKPLGVKAPSGGTVILGADQEPRTLNTFILEGNMYWGSVVTNPVLEGMYTFDNKGQQVLKAAESITLRNRSPLTVDWKIKAAAKWSDGRHVSADDVIFTFTTIMNKNWTITSRVGYEDIRRIRKLNDKTVRVIFKKPYAPYRLLFGRLIPKHKAQGQNFDQYWRNGLDIASGPFRFTSWNRGSQMVISKNPTYHGKKATLNQIVFRFIPDTNTQFQAMRGGEVNMIAPQPQLQIADIRKQAGITVQAGPEFAWEHLDMQWGPTGHPALKRLFVRQALVTGINRRQIATALYREIAPNLPVLNNAIYKPFQTQYVAHRWQPFGFSQRKAIEILRQNGCTGGPARPGAGGIYSCPGVGRLSFNFGTTAGNQLRELAFAIMQQQLKSVGIELKAAFFPATQLSSTLVAKRFEVVLFTWIGSSDPGGSVNIHKCGGPQNFNDYCSRPVSRLLIKSNEEVDPKKRTALMNEADRLMATHLPTLPLFARPGFLIHDSRIRGALKNPTNAGPTWNAENWSFAR